MQYGAYPTCVEAKILHQNLPRYGTSKKMWKKKDQNKNAHV